MRQASGNQLVPLQVIGAEQHHRARALLEDRGLLVRAESPGGITGPVGLAYGLTNLHGLLWVRADRAAEAQRLIEHAGIYVTGTQCPIVDRSEPHCPTCGADLDQQDDSDEGACRSCGLEFHWIDIAEPEIDPAGLLCSECGYDLTANTAGRCPECSAPIPVDTSALVEHAAREAGHGKTPPPAPHSPRSVLISGVVLLGLALIFAVVVMMDDWVEETGTTLLLGIGAFVIVICVLMYLGDRARRGGAPPQ